MTVARPVVAFVTAVAAGLAENLFSPSRLSENEIVFSRLRKAKIITTGIH